MMRGGTFLIKAVLFDLDGTLLDRDRSVRQFIAMQYDRLKSELGHIVKEDYVNRFIEIDNHGYVWKDKVYDQLCNEFRIVNLSSEKLLQDYLQHFKQSCVAFPSMISMLDKLKKNNHRLGIITNGYGQFQMDNINSLRIEAYFDAIFISEWEKMRKPDPRLFLRALDRLKVAPYESIFIGDHPENDVKAAKEVGMIGIWKKSIYWKSADTDLVIDELDEIPAIIEKLNSKSFA